ncbi:MAG TPA: HlyD family efflux transporter periplasmic adaptor subunit [Candidatus Binatia bacterium]|jgi:multidrug resistance efflux pump
MKPSTVVAVGLAGVFVLGTGYSLWNYAGNRESVVISGYIEADDIHVGSKVGGRVLKVVAREGETVKAGEALILLEPGDLAASLAEAQANLRQAEAKYSLLNAGYRVEEIEQAEAALKQAQAEFAQLTSEPRHRQIDQAMTEWMEAKVQAEKARKTLKRAEDLSNRDLIARKEAEEALATTVEAEQKVKAARQRYDLLAAGTQQDELERSRQRVIEASAKLRQLRTGYRREEIAQAKSALEAARAKVQWIHTQLDETVIRSPADALVETLDLETGDLVGAGKSVVTLLRTGSLWVRAYLPQAQLRYVRTGEKAYIRVDSFPDRSFGGVVRRIHRQSEAGPRDAQTDESRILPVFETEVVINDPDHVLRPGMTADIAFPKA